MLCSLPVNISNTVQPTIAYAILMDEVVILLEDNEQVRPAFERKLDLQILCQFAPTQVALVYYRH